MRPRPPGGQARRQTSEAQLLHYLVQFAGRKEQGAHTVVVGLGGRGSRGLASGGLRRRSRALGKTVIRQEEAQPAQRALEVGRVVHGGGQPGVEIRIGLGLADGRA